MLRPNHALFTQLCVAVTMLVVAIGATPAGATPACDTPLIVQQGVVPPNVLLILDSSGSMNHHIYHEDYVEATAWSGPFGRFTTYYFAPATPALVAPSDFNAALADTSIVEPEFLASAGPNGQSGQYFGNYLNWIFYHATAEQRALVPTLTLMDSAHLALNLLLDRAAGLRFGLMTFNGAVGGVLRSPVGTSVASLRTTIDGVAGGGYTPSAETLLTALTYFQKSDASAPIQEACQGNYIVFVTDGYPTKDLNVPAWIGDQDGDGRDPGNCDSIGLIGANSDCSDWMDDVAYYLAHEDMRSDLDGDQFVNTYTIGFGINAPLVVDTASNGGGLYNSAWDTESLIASLGTVIADILNRISAGSAVAVVSTESGDDNHLYRGKFLPGLWRGYLEAYSLPYANGDVPVWEAGNLLRTRAANTRNLFTLYNGSTISFDANAANDLMADLGAIDVDEATDIINFTRGDDVDGMRGRNGWKLGDLVYSTPVVVGTPALFLLTQEYQNFLAAHYDRERMIYVGANDGILHSFHADSGQEAWGYVPTGTMGKLSSLMDPEYCHQTTVDLTPIVSDVYVNGAWRTVLFGGERTGGDSYFAIDITYPGNPVPLWEYSYPILGSSYTKPAVVRTPSYTALWTGSAPDVGGNAYVNLIDASTGALLVGTYLMSSIADINMCGEAVALDMDFDGYDDYVYQGDLAGNMWRFKRISGDDWQIEKLFDTGGKPIQARPTLATTESNELMVFFGSGRFLQGSDMLTVDQQTFYAVTDDIHGAFATYGPSDLADQTSSIGDVTGTHGWYFDLTKDAKERVIEPAAVVSGVVYFSSFAPNAEPCSAGGESWVYGVDYLSGANIDPDTEEPTSDISGRGESAGDGIASRPVISLGDGSLIIQTSDSRLNVSQLAIPPQTMLVRSWRERTAGTNAQGAQTQSQ
jgi:type IV pilus assembly protein PilY1